MADISMCEGNGCEVKHTCYRFTAKPSNYQSYLAPTNIEDKGCEYYINNK
jgi:hypothetical protein